MGSVTIGLASAEDDEELRGFVRKTPMEGGIRLSFLKEPSYFGALEVEGTCPEVIVARNERRKIVGVGNRCVKSVFVNGRPESIGYISGLRLMKKHRHGKVLLRGYQFLKTLHKERPVMLYLTTIMEDNLAARKTLEGRRREMPVYHDFGRFYAMAINMKQKPKAKDTGGLIVRSTTEDDGKRIESFLMAEGAKKQFFPLYAADEILKGTGALKGLKRDDILLAFKGDELIGMVAAWDQTSFRQILIAGYRFPLNFARPFYNLFAGLRRYPLLPRAKSEFQSISLSLICVKGNDEGVFENLLAALFRRCGSRYPLMMCGLHERDPLLPVLTKYRHFACPSRLYLVYWEEGEDIPTRLDPDRIPYLELGGV